MHIRGKKRLPCSRFNRPGRNRPSSQTAGDFLATDRALTALVDGRESLAFYFKFFRTFVPILIIPTIRKRSNINRYTVQLKELAGSYQAYDGDTAVKLGAAHAVNLAPWAFEIYVKQQKSPIALRMNRESQTSIDDDMWGSLFKDCSIITISYCLHYIRLTKHLYSSIRFIERGD
jgi:hypothetical protein